MIKGLDYWYDGQMRRFLEQVVRAFSGFKYQTGQRVKDGVLIPPQLVMVPARLASSDRLVAQLMKNGSDNVLLAPPLITIHQTSLQGRRGDVQSPSHVDARLVTERAIDPDTGSYTAARGRSYTVERPMPRPFEMTVQVDIWTSNMEQKNQLAEQILTVMYPDFLIQNSDNALDWTALTSMSIEDINLSSRSIPVGVDSEIDIMTLTMKIPFWLSPPVKIQQQRIIEQIVTNIHDARTGEELTTDNYLTRVITTPGEYSIGVDGNKISLLGPKDLDHNDAGKPNDWKELLMQYGHLRPTISKLHLRNNPDLDDVDHDITGTIQLDANFPNELFWQIDLNSLPENTIAPIDAVIDPRKSFPGNELPSQVNGQRYLINDSVSGPSEAWGALNAHKGDIIEYRSGSWTVAYRPANGTAPQYMLNKHTGRQLKWDGSQWVLTIGGIYAPGMWRLHL